MIIIKFSGGLGNQLYQYALYCMLHQRYPNTKIKADISDYKLYDVHYGYELDRIFGQKGTQMMPCANVVEQFFCRGEIPIFCGGKFGKKLEKIIAGFNARSRKFFVKKDLIRYIDEERINDIYAGEEKAIHIRDELKQLDASKNWYIAGYWQDELMYDEKIERLCKKVEFPPFTDEINSEWKEKIEACNSVSIHVRRGDYVGTKYDILTMDYYRNAVEYIKNEVRNPVFYVFSEDANYINEAFDWLDNKFVISNNSGRNSYKDMQLMSLCKYNIIANSTFSEWAAYLNRYDDKIVVYPEVPTMMGGKTEKYGKNWKKISGRGNA